METCPGPNTGRNLGHFQDSQDFDPLRETQAARALRAGGEAGKSRSHLHASDATNGVRVSLKLISLRFTYLVSASAGSRAKSK
jgi:hypothetical protein